MNKLTLVLSGLMLALSLYGCSAQESTGDCVEDIDCGPGLFCTDQNTCACTTDDLCELALGEGYFCNNFGSCQVRPPCLGNQDCEADEICNASNGGECIPADSCGSTVHCDFNEYCNPTTGQCESGCRNEGDCQLGYICLEGQCSPGDCSSCPNNPPDATYCDYGELCTEQGQCIPHSLASVLCQTCSQTSSCPLDSICLLDDMVQNSAYCAPTCDEDIDCPNGYPGCGKVQVVTQQGCAVDQDCVSGGRCLGAAEGTLTYCSCMRNSDCMDPQVDTFCLGGICATDFVTSCSQGVDCLCSLGECINAPGIRCNNGADCATSCAFEENSNGDSIGICQTNWKVCGKEQGKTCTELRSGDSDCNSL